MTKPNDPAKGTTVLGEKENGSAYVYTYGGLTKREYFAAQAMQGFIGKYPIKNELGAENWKILADASVAMADALIEALPK